MQVLERYQLRVGYYRLCGCGCKSSFYCLQLHTFDWFLHRFRGIYQTPQASRVRLNFKFLLITSVQYLGDFVLPKKANFLCRANMPSVRHLIKESPTILNTIPNNPKPLIILCVLYAVYLLAVGLAFVADRRADAYIAPAEDILFSFFFHQLFCKC